MSSWGGAKDLEILSLRSIMARLSSLSPARCTWLAKQGRYGIFLASSMERLQYKAVDIVALPQGRVKDTAIDLSAKIPDSAVYLNVENRLPHVTLAMGYAQNVETIIGEVKEVVSEIQPFDLLIEGVRNQFIDVRKDEGLLGLHAKLVQSVSLKWDMAYASGFLDWEVDNPNVLTLDWISSFRSKHSFENYEPHITLGATAKIIEPWGAVPLPEGFSVEAIYVCHLGNFNTCRKILGKVPLLRQL